MGMLAKASNAVTRIANKHGPAGFALSALSTLLFTALANAQTQLSSHKTHYYDFAGSANTHISQLRRN
jgi:formiminotetrahydrofolate cyclodeaminase